MAFDHKDVVEGGTPKLNARPDLAELMHMHMKTVIEHPINNPKDESPGRGILPEMPPGHKKVEMRMNAGDTFQKNRPRAEGLKRGDAV